MVDEIAYRRLMLEFGEKVHLVAVSKTKSVDEIMALYELGHRDFGENYVQEMVGKHLSLPKDIRWHFIGHLQSNKVKYIADFVHLIQGVDTVKLLMEINKQAIKIKRTISCLLQVHIAQEETKFGLSEEELDELINGITKLERVHEFSNVKVVGLMGMASLTDDLEKVRIEFKYLSALYDKYCDHKTDHLHFKTLSMGMSADYKVAIEEGSNMVRIGSLIFGARDSL